MQLFNNKTKRKTKGQPLSNEYFCHRCGFSFDLELFTPCRQRLDAAKQQLGAVWNTTRRKASLRGGIRQHALPHRTPVRSKPRIQAKRIRRFRSSAASSQPMRSKPRIRSSRIAENAIRFTLLLQLVVQETIERIQIGLRGRHNDISIGAATGIYLAIRSRNADSHLA